MSVSGVLTLNTCKENKKEISRRKTKYMIRTKCLVIRKIRQDFIVEYRCLVAILLPVHFFPPKFYLQGTVSGRISLAFFNYSQQYGPEISEDQRRRSWSLAFLISDSVQLCGNPLTWLLLFYPHFITLSGDFGGVTTFATPAPPCAILLSSEKFLLVREQAIMNGPSPSFLSQNFRNTLRQCFTMRKGWLTPRAGWSNFQETGFHPSFGTPFPVHPLVKNGKIFSSDHVRSTKIKWKLRVIKKISFA